MRGPCLTPGLSSSRPLTEGKRHEMTAMELDAGIPRVARIALRHEPIGVALGVVRGTIVHGGFAIVPPAPPVVRDAVGYGEAEWRRVEAGIDEAAEVGDAQPGPEVARRLGLAEHQSDPQAAHIHPGLLDIKPSP